MSLFFLSTPWLLVLFILAGTAIWIAGIKLTIALDKMSKYFHFGEAMGGMIFLAIVTNLPEIAITGIAAWNRNLDIAVSNLLGGIAIQTVVLALIDFFGVGKTAPLSYKSSSVGLLLEGIILILILSLVILGKQVHTDFTILHGSMVEWAIFFTWIIGIYLIYKNPHVNSRKKSVELKKVTTAETNVERISPKQARIAVTIFILLAIITLISGLVLELCSEALAARFEISNILFGATILAMVTAIPEISTGIESAKLKNYQMAVSDIFGGNAFLPVLLLMGSIISKTPTIATLDASDMYLVALGILLTGIYLIGLIIKSPKQFFRLGFDSWSVIIVYAIGIIGILFVV